MSEADDSHETDRKASSDTQLIATDVAALRNLAHQLKRMAPSADEHALRAILGKREALMDSIRRRLADKNAFEELQGVDNKVPVETHRLLYDVVSEILVLDRESARVLKQRAESVAAEIQKVRAGRKWRESAGLWK